jgi:hypothetical protein
LKTYKYSFLLNNKSNLDLFFNYKTNFITKLFLKIEKQKNISFKYIEKYKKEYLEKLQISQENIINNYYLEKVIF